LTAPTRVLVADDHAPTRLGVRLVLENEGFVICAEAADAAAAVELAVRTQPDLCLLDVHMPGGGIEAARAITAHVPTARVVMLTVSRNDDDLFRALDAGACGYLLKGSDSQRLAHALRGALADEAAMPRVLASRLITEFRERSRKERPALARRDANSLTSREWEVVDLLREGLPTAKIAKRLFISETTVRRHVGAILRKLGVSDRAAAIRAVGRR
jgi:two-component system NarL family response regulator